MTDDKLTIEDLAVRVAPFATEDATESDLVEVLEGLGAYVSEFSELTDLDGNLIAHPGTYLVWRIE